jgi:hypothetical protein
MAPQVRVEHVTVRRGATADRWKIEWRIENLAAGPLKILAARLPHGKFRSEERDLAPALVLEPGRSGTIELEAQCGGTPGSVVENAFLILRVLWSTAPWLILARLRVSVNDEGTPLTTTELITTQPVGFSQQKAQD